MIAQRIAAVACLAAAAWGQTPPLAIDQPPPVYPKLAVQARIEGTVRLVAWITEDGAVERLELISGHPFLVKAAIEAARSWRYRPMIWNGQPVATRIVIEVPFRLSRTLPEGRPVNRPLVAASCEGDILDCGLLGRRGIPPLGGV